MLVPGVSPGTDATGPERLKGSLVNNEKNQNLSRRSMFRSAGKLILAATIVELLPKSALRVGETAYGAVVTYSDINVRCIGKTQPLLATDLIKGEAFKGKVDEGGHTHTYDVTKEQMDMIIAGKIVTLKSSVGSDGSGAHTVTIDPKALLAKGKTIKVFKSENGDRLAVRLGDSSQPYIYVEGAEELDATTVKMCLGLAAACQAETAFGKMEIVADIKDRQVFSSVDRVSVAGEQYVHVWATTKTGKAAKIIAKISK